jgi:hypothetical protein
MSVNPLSAHTRRIRALRADAHRAVIHYFEKHEDAIGRLTPEERLDILSIYLDALFAVGEYGRHLRHVEDALPLSLDVEADRSGELFRHLLFQKAASLYQTGAVDKSAHVLSELLRMEPTDRMARRFLARCHQRSLVRFRLRFRATAVAAWLASAAVIALETLWVRPFLPEWAPVVEISRNVLFVLAALILGAGELLTIGRSRRRVTRLIATLSPARRPAVQHLLPWR